MSASTVAVTSHATAQTNNPDQLRLPLRAKNHPSHGLTKGPRQGKHGDALDIAELCRRLELVKKERRAAAGQAARKPTEKSSSKDVPYHHVPRTAAKDFARTTASESQGLRGSHLFSPKPTTSVKAAPGAQKRSGKRMSHIPPRDLTETQRKSWKPSPLASKHPTAFLDRSNLVHRSNSVAPASSCSADIKNMRHGRSTERSDGYVFEYLTGHDQAFRGLNIENIDSAEATVTELGAQEEAPILAHKITRQHLEDRADWSQSDADPSKHVFKDLIRSFAKKSNNDSSAVSSELLDAEKSTDAKLSRRRSSFLVRHFLRGVEE